jgi:thioredoxin-like negative regulator of GroEL
MSGEIGLALARVSLARGRADGIESKARAGMSVDPAAAHELLAWSALFREDLARAEREGRLALQMAPAGTGSALALAEVLVRRSELSEALAVLERARRLSRAGRPVRGFELARGDVLARLGRNSEAEVAFRREIDAFPGNSEAYARLAIVYALEGRTRAEVGRLLESMQRANPDRTTAALAAKTLASIGDPGRAALGKRPAGSGP